MTEILKPPPTLITCRVVRYAIVNRTVSYCGSNLLKAGKEVGPVPCLAIVYRPIGCGAYLLHCDRDWSILGTEWWDSLDDAAASAEKAYPGISALCVEADFTEEEIDKHFREAWADQRCSFCQKPLADSGSNIEKNGVWICEPCIRSCYELLQKDAGAS